MEQEEKLKEVKYHFDYNYQSYYEKGFTMMIYVLVEKNIEN
jgi:hypothetical protein